MHAVVAAIAIRMYHHFIPRGLISILSAELRYQSTQATI
jgi:hypothetical protein